MHTNVNTMARKRDSARAQTIPPCIVCGSDLLELFFEIESVPTQCNVLLPSRDEALNAPTGAIQLGYCQDCGHIFNTAFDPEKMEYNERYENSLHFSQRFQRYLDAMINGLDERYQLHSKHVIDVGCGKGEFLEALCRKTGAFGTGFDRSYVASGTDAGEPDSRANFVVDFFSEDYADQPVDLLTCRHVLEHIADPVAFLAMIRRTIGDRPGVALFLEVPNALFTIRRHGVWDVIYEHVSYFTPNSLSTLLAATGFHDIQICEVFDGQYLTATAIAGDGPGCHTVWEDDRPDRLQEDILAFRNRYGALLEDWRRTLSVIRRNQLRTVIWGTGSKGVTFLNALNVGTEVPMAVDINPRKTGMYVPGTGQLVVTPELLPPFNPELVILMNRIYEGEVAGTIRSLDLDAEIIRA